MVVTSFFFGPVMSRRLGSSLGIDLLPRGEKNCTFNCLYCEIGRGRPVSCNKRFNYYPDSIQAFKSQLKIIIEEEKPASLTFVGYLGEPTLNEVTYEFLDATYDLLRELKNKISIPTILSNSSTLSDPKIQENIVKFKRLVMKLDAADQGTFRIINQPHSSVPNIKTIIENLALIRKKLPSSNELILQTLMTDKNDNEDNINSLINAYNTIKPKSVQLYSISRPPAYPTVKRLTKADLEKIKKKLEIDVDNSIQIDIY